MALAQPKESDLQKNLEVIIIKILNKKALKIKKNSPIGLLLRYE